MLIDTNCCYGTWPFARLELQSRQSFEDHLDASGIDRALVTNIEAVLCPDPDLPNRDLFETFAGSESVVPVPTIDPSMSHWQTCLEAYSESDHAGAVCIVPNYHRYSLEDGPADDLADALGDLGSCLMIQVRVEDERGQYPLMKVPGVDVDEITAFATRHPNLPILCRCCYLYEAKKLTAASENLHVEISYVEFLDTLTTLLDSCPAKQVLFGSHTPMFYTLPALTKLSDADLDDETLALVRSDNATRIIPDLT